MKRNLLIRSVLLAWFISVSPIFLLAAPIEYELVDIYGENKRISDYQGRLLLVNFGRPGVGHVFRRFRISLNFATRLATGLKSLVSLSKKHRLIRFGTLLRNST